MNVFVIGDSISVQYGPYLEQLLRAGGHGYARRDGAAVALANLDIPQGANGGDSGMVLAYLRYRQQAGGIAADLLLVNCGLHDIKTDPSSGAVQTPLDRYRANLESIIAIAADLQPRLVWIRTTPCHEAVHNRPGMQFHRFSADCVAYNAEADAVMRAAGVPIIDLFAFTSSFGDDLYCDHVHFHDPLRRQQAAFLAGWVNGFAVNAG